MILRPAGGAAAALGGGDGDMEQPDEELSLSISADSDRKKQINMKRLVNIVYIREREPDAPAEGD